MRRTAGERWHCLDRACGKTLPVTGTDDEAEARLCECGSPMKKSAQSVVFSYLNFLREETTNEDGKITRKEQRPWEI